MTARAHRPDKYGAYGWWFVEILRKRRHAAALQTVYVSPSLAPVPTPPNYVVLRNADQDRLIALATRHPTLMFFNFVDQEEPALRFTRLEFGDLENVVQPVWIGNFPEEDRAAVIDQVISNLPVALGTRVEVAP